MKDILGLFFLLIQNCCLIFASHITSKLILKRSSKTKINLIDTIIINTFFYIIFAILTVIVAGLLGLVNSIAITLITLLIFIPFIIVYSKNINNVKHVKSFNNIPQFNKIFSNKSQLIIKAFVYSCLIVIGYKTIFQFMHVHDCYQFQNSYIMNIINKNSLFDTKALFWYYPKNTELMFLFYFLPFRHEYFSSFQNIPFIIAFVILIYRICVLIRIKKKLAIIAALLPLLFLVVQYNFTHGTIYKNDISLLSCFLFSLYFMIVLIKTKKIKFLYLLIVSIALMTSVKASGVLYSGLLVAFFFVFILTSKIKKRKTIELHFRRNDVFLVFITLIIFGLLNYQYIYNFLKVGNFFKPHNETNWLFKTTYFYKIFLSTERSKYLVKFIKMLLTKGFFIANFLILVLPFSLLIKRQRAFRKPLLTSCYFLIGSLFILIVTPFSATTFGRFLHIYVVISIIIMFYFLNKVYRKSIKDIYLVLLLLSVVLIEVVFANLILKIGYNVIHYLKFIIRYIGLITLNIKTFIFNETRSNMFMQNSFLDFVPILLLITILLSIKNKLLSKYLNKISSVYKKKAVYIIVLIIVLLCPFLKTRNKHLFFKKNALFTISKIQNINPLPLRTVNNVYTYSKVLDFVNKKIHFKNIYISPVLYVKSIWKYLFYDTNFTNTMYFLKSYKDLNKLKHNEYVIFSTQEKIKKIKHQFTYLYKGKYFLIAKKK